MNQLVKKIDKKRVVLINKRNNNKEGALSQNMIVSKYFLLYVSVITV
jgi:hypothetical protein